MLGGTVAGRKRLLRALLGSWRPIRRAAAEVRDRRHRQEAPDPELHSQRGDVVAAGHVGRLHLLRRQGQVELSAGVDHPVSRRHPLPHRVPVRQITDETASAQFLERLRVTRCSDQTAELVTVAGEAATELQADEASPSSDKDAHGIQLSADSRQGI